MTLFGLSTGQFVRGQLAVAGLGTPGVARVGFVALPRSLAERSRLVLTTGIVMILRPGRGRSANKCKGNPIVCGMYGYNINGSLQMRQVECLAQIP